MPRLSTLVGKPLNTIGVRTGASAPPPVLHYMIIGGGGGAGSGNSPGGGGAGGIYTNIVSPFSSATVNPLAAVMPFGVGFSYTISIGGGGTGQNTNAGVVNASGGTSSLSRPGFSISAIGGGRGGAVAPVNGPVYNHRTGDPGGCGGGAASGTAAQVIAGTGYGFPGTGYQGASGGLGGVAPPGPGFGGGGGGRILSGGGNASSPFVGGNGGSGANWRGVAPVGGGGGARGTGPASIPGSGGTGGGGPAVNTAPVSGGPNSGTPGTGGGGGGANTWGGNGGSGCVVIGYPGTPRATGGSISSAGGYTWHTFTGAGTFTITG